MFDLFKLFRSRSEEKVEPERSAVEQWKHDYGDDQYAADQALLVFTNLCKRYDCAEALGLVKYGWRELSGKIELFHVGDE